MTAADLAMPARVLIVDDDAELCRLVGDALRRRGYATATYECGEEALTALAAEDFDVVVTDVRMPGIGGVQLCERIVGNHPDMPVVVLTAYGVVDTAVGAIRAGACEFLRKPVSPEELSAAIARAVGRREGERAVKRLGAPPAPDTEPLGELVGSSDAMRRVASEVCKAAVHDSNVLLVGESGTGKELVAKLIHRCGKRSDGPFVAVNCAAIPETLLESELFGHEKGAFTGAQQPRQGFLRRAEGGTLFLDEIGAMPPELQPKVLRAIQERRVRPVGGDAERPFDARLITATNADLEQAVRQGTFREDLLFRIDVLRIVLPPLRDRGDDVVELAHRFLQELAPGGVRSFTEEALERLRRHGWPGNVRELRNAVEAALALTRGEHIDVVDLPPAVRRGSAPAPGEGEGSLSTLAEVERRHIERVLEAVQGNKAEAARLLGISRATLYRKLRRREAD